jgi:adenylosuccinate synthase
MPVDIIIGAQWGDEGKGHITDLLAAEADIVARFGGGDNAGHTVTIGPEIFKLHLVPSGIVQERTICLLGNGMVINPAVLIREMEELERNGIDVSPDRLIISSSAHLITDGHIALDEARESARGADPIGTTRRGIGPAYSDKAARVGLRAGLLTQPDKLKEVVKAHIYDKNFQLDALYKQESLDAEEISNQFLAYSQRLGPYVRESSKILWHALDNGQRILAEGAQGTFLDLDHGTYPYVTSSWPTSGGAIIGLGIGVNSIDRVIGVAKVFTSRVGSGPFPCEITGDLANRLRGTGENPWDEFGTTTGRPRRVGWLDLVMLNHAHRLNDFSSLAVTKLDILSGIEEILVCTSYRHNGKQSGDFPLDLSVLGAVEPVYEVLPGWDQDISSIKRFDELPIEVQDYVNFIAASLNIEAPYLSVGPGREQIINRLYN